MCQEVCLFCHVGRPSAGSPCSLKFVETRSAFVQRDGGVHNEESALFYCKPSSQELGVCLSVCLSVSYCLSGLSYMLEGLQSKAVLCCHKQEAGQDSSPKTEFPSLK